jgi:hypothetical protein
MDLSDRERRRLEAGLADLGTEYKALTGWEQQVLSRIAGDAQKSKIPVLFAAVTVVILIVEIIFVVLG